MRQDIVLHLLAFCTLVDLLRFTGLFSGLFWFTDLLLLNESPTFSLPLQCGVASPPCLSLAFYSTLMNGFHSDRVKLVALFLFWLLDCVLCS